MGQGASKITIVICAIIALTSFFYIYTAGSYFKVGIYPLENRVTNIIFFDRYVISKYVDHLIIAFGIIVWIILSCRATFRFILFVIYAGLTVIALALDLETLLDIVVIISFPMLISATVYNKFSSKKKIIETNTYLILNYLAFIAIATGILSIISSLLPLFSILPTVISIRNYAFEISVLFSSFSHILIFLLIFCFPLKLLIREFTVGILKTKNSITLYSYERIKTRNKAIFLTLILVLSITVVLIPHHPAINKQNRLVGVDTLDVYGRALNILLQSKTTQELIQQSFLLDGGDRPLTLLFLFSIVKAVPADLYHTVDNMPMILGPALILVVYFLTRQLTSNDTIALLASFMTAVSYHMLIGIYAGFYANWIALVIGYLSFVFLFRFLKKASILNLVSYSIVVMLLIFCHLYTWSILTIVAGIFLTVMLIFKNYPRKSVIILLLVVLSSVVVDFVRWAVTSSGSGIEKDIQAAYIYKIGLEQFSQRWANLIYAMQIHVGGLLSNFIIIILGLYWVFRSNLKDPPTIFLIIFLSTGIIPLFIGNAVIQARVLFDIPFQVPAAIVLGHLKNRRCTGIMVLLSICLWLIAIAITDVSNFIPN
jgi:hypothetical protein